MDIVLNEHTRTAHKPRAGTSNHPTVPDLHTACGATLHLAHNQVQLLPLELAAAEYNADKCGRCFEDGGCY